MFWVRRLGGGAPNGVKFPGSSQSHAPLEMTEFRSEEHIILPPFPNLNANFKNLFFVHQLKADLHSNTPLRVDSHRSLDLMGFG